MSRSLSIALAATLSCAASVAAAADIDVVTQNQYLGADLGPVLDAATAPVFDPGAFNAAVVTALSKIAASRPAERALALAELIAQRHPDVVGLQEAYRFSCAPHPAAPPVPGKGCDDPAIRGAFTDMLDNTTAALHGRYVLAGKVGNLQVAGIPFAVNGYPAILSLADRDAILVRAGISAVPVDLGALTGCRVSDQGCNYNTRPPVVNVDTPAGRLSIAIERGYLAVDFSLAGQAYRVFNTHLEQRLLAPSLPATRLLQVGQSIELLGSALGTWDGRRKLIAVGDFNSAPADTIPGAPTPYQVFTGGGFADAWVVSRPRGEGFTCCQAEDLSNWHSALYERIDMIFSLAPLARVVDAKLLGTSMGDKTRPPGRGGLWPSDHASLAAGLFFD